MAGHATHCHATHCHDTLEAEDVESPLTTPPSFPVPMEEDPVVGFQKVAEHFCISYIHNHVSGLIFITYFIEGFFCSSFAAFVRMVEHFIAAAGAEGQCACFALSCLKNTRTLS